LLLHPPQQLLVLAHPLLILEQRTSQTLVLNRQIVVRKLQTGNRHLVLVDLALPLTITLLLVRTLLDYHHQFLLRRLGEFHDAGDHL
jgi:hypothetical protein